jgi:hypothetical protein
MAKVTVNSAVLPSPPPPPPVVPATYDLRLNAEEMAALWIVLQKVGGVPETSIRGHIAAISEAVSDAVPEFYKTCWFESEYHDRGINSLLSDNSQLSFKAFSKNDPKFRKLVEAARRKV